MDWWRTRLISRRGLRRGRERDISFHTSRFAWICVVALAAVLCLGTARLWWGAQRGASDEALAVLGHVQSRMAMIDNEIDQLLRHASSHDTAACLEPERQVLARASVASPHVRQFGRLLEGHGAGCWPDGLGPAPVLPRQADRLLQVGALRQDEASVWVWRAVPAQAGGGHVVAELDTRVFADWVREPDALMQPTLPAAVRLVVWLTGSNGQRIARLGPPATEAAGEELLTTQAQSDQYGVGVQVIVDGASWERAAWRRAGWALPMALAVLSAAAALMFQRGLRRSRLFNRIQRAARRRQFEPFVQPIIDLSTGKCAGGEVLMRWDHPQRGILTPAEFIDEAERTGLIVPMSDTVMARASHRLASVVREHPELYFSFNVTPLQLRQPGFVGRLGELFNDDALPRHNVLLELTEREFVDGDAGTTLRALQAAGWRMAIDDFGTGHSSLASLEQLAIDRIKIDRAFVRTIDDQTVNRPVLDAIIALAAQLRVPLIAEGVETCSQWDYLAARGVGHAQGFLMAKPMPIAAFRAWLEERLVSASSERPGHLPAAALAPPLAVDDSQFRALWQQMRMPGGLDVRDRIHHLRRYRRCFVGREAVDWIVQRLGIGRAEAVSIGKRLLALDLIRHVLNEHDFEDAEYFFELVLPVSDTAASLPDGDALSNALVGPHGVGLRDHGRGLVLHRDCARGRDIVDWIVNQYDVSRDVATQWSAHLMRKGDLRHVFDDRPFQDDRTLYRPN